MTRRVLMLGWGYPPDIDGGLDIHVSRLFEELREKGVEVDLALPEERAPDRPGIIPLKAEGEHMREKAEKMSREILEIADEYDIIHTHDWFGAESGLRAKKYSDLKWVSTFHSTCDGRTTNPSREIMKLERAMAEKSDSLIAVSRVLQEEVVDNYGRKPEVVFNGFSSPESNGIDVRQRLGIDDERPMIFYVGRHAEQKGVELLIYGFRKLLEERDAVLVVGGKGHMTGILKDFAEMLGVSDDVVFTGFIPDEELGDYYGAAEVFVSPSINEPFGLTVTEAIESGTPVVATRSGVEDLFPRDMIVNVQPDSDSIKNGILKALEKDGLPEYERRRWSDVAEEIAEKYDDL